jgi:hypothetical protein
MDNKTENNKISGLTSFSVKGFKSLYDVEFEPGYLNIFIGANGSGKSNILEAIGVYGAAVSGTINEESLSSRGVRLGQPAIYKSAFKEHILRSFITIDGKWEDDFDNIVDYRVGIGNPLEQPQKAWYYNTELLEYNMERLFSRGIRGSKGIQMKVDDKNGSSTTVLKGHDKYSGLIATAKFLQKLDKTPVEFLDSLSNYAVYMPTTPVLRGTMPDSSTRPTVGIYGGGLAETINNLIAMYPNKRINLDIVFELIDWISQLGITAGEPLSRITSPTVGLPKRVVRFKDKYMREGRNILTGYDASEGALYVLFLLSLVLHEKSPRLFAVDNFDSGIHPRLLVEIVKIISQILIEENITKKQVFLTCHNPLVLDGLPLNDPRIRLFAVDRDDKGCTIVNRITVDTEALVKIDMPLSFLWTSERIGGVPKGF